MVRSLRAQGYGVNRKRVQRLMRVLGLAGMAPGPHTSKPHPEHKIYPYPDIVSESRPKIAMFAG